LWLLGLGISEGRIVKLTYLFSLECLCRKATLFHSPPLPSLRNLFARNPHEKVVELDPPSRQQLLRERSSNSQSNLDHGEGGKGKEQKREQPLFSTLAAVPTQALSLTIPAIMRSRVLSCVATGGNEAGASGTGKRESVYKLNV
jgi:hypothetical protein